MFVIRLSIVLFQFLFIFFSPFLVFVFFLSFPSFLLFCFSCSSDFEMFLFRFLFFHFSVLSFRFSFFCFSDNFTSCHPVMLHLFGLFSSVLLTCLITVICSVSVSSFRNLFWHVPLPVFLQVWSGERSVRLQRSHVRSSLWSGRVWILLHRSGSLHLRGRGRQVWTCESSFYPLTLDHLEDVTLWVLFTLHHLMKLFIFKSFCFLWKIIFVGERTKQIKCSECQKRKYSW